VKRAIDTKPAEHGKNTELFIGNHLTVARGVKGTQAGEHKNGDVVRNFPTAPDGPPTTGAGVSICGQKEASEGTTPSGPTATPLPGATTVTVSLTEFKLTPDPASAPAGAVTFQVTDTGTTQHNFRLVKTDDAPDQLPVSGSKVDESQLDVIAKTNGDLNAGASQSLSATLEAGNYVLFCNVAGHYKLGMHATFTVE
jgi:uncharacterized cupredoxin-like copper-binding protein